MREALAFGVPFVASDTASFRPEGVTLFPEGDASDLAAKLTQVLSPPGGVSRPP